jgi:membrane-associated phospholipid phosphatase
MATDTRVDQRSTSAPAHTSPPEIVAALAVAAALFVALWVVGWLLTDPLADSAIVEWDVRVVESLADNRTDLLDTLTGIGTFVGDTVPVSVLWVLAMIIGWRWTRSWLPPLFVLITVGTEKLIYLGTSILVDRPRPDVETLGHAYATASFPSGHVASAITLYGSIAVLCWAYRAPKALRNVTLGVTIVAPLAVGFSRLYRGFHFPTDVIAGVVLGAVWLYVTTTVLLLPARERERAARAVDNDS